MLGQPGSTRALAASETTSQLVLETMKALTELFIHNCVRLLWVPGHSDIVGNEEADKLANEAAAAEYIGPEPALGFPLLLFEAKYGSGLIMSIINTGLIVNTEGC